MRTRAALALTALIPAVASAQLYYQRATQGPTGITSGSGVSTDAQFYTGWRFQVTNGPIQTVNIGGHFSQSSGTAFGAIVQLTGSADHPDSYNLTTPDVLARNLITMPLFPGGSAVCQAPMNLTLQNGWYMVIFGSGAFGATSTFAGLLGQDAGTAIPGVQGIVSYRQAGAPGGELYIPQAIIARVFVEYTLGTPCYPNCDNSTTLPLLNVLDFTCFLNQFAAGATYANCDNSTNPPLLNVLDFTCFLNRFAAGCT